MGCETSKVLPSEVEKAEVSLVRVSFEGDKRECEREKFSIESEKLLESWIDTTLWQGLFSFLNDSSWFKCRTFSFMAIAIIKNNFVIDITNFLQYFVRTFPVSL